MYEMFDFRFSMLSIPSGFIFSKREAVYLLLKSPSTYPYFLNVTNNPTHPPRILPLPDTCPPS